MNENGQRVLELCSKHGLCNIWFKQKVCQRVSWRHPRSKHWHQLNLAITRKRDIGLFKWSRTYHSADGETHHCLVLSQVDLSKKKPVPKKQKIRPCLNTTAMKQTDNVSAFCTALEAKLTAGAPEETRNLDETWEYLRTALHDEAVESFGIKRPPREDWMAENADILEPLLSIENKAHKDHINRPTRSTKTKLEESSCQFQKAARRCANNHWNILCDEIQQAAGVRDLREMYRGLRKATGPSAEKVCSLKSTTGELITDCTKQLERWVEHYSALYREPRNITAAALASTPSFDTMVELLKCENRLLPNLYNLLCIGWCSGKFPTAMKDAKIVTVQEGRQR